MMLKIIWKTHFLNCFLHFLTFSQHPNRYIIQFFNRLTQILLNSSKPNQKKLIKLGQIHQNPTISQSQTQCDRCRRSRSRTAILASGFAGEVNGCDSKSKLWVCGAKSLGLRWSRSSGFVARSLWVAGEVGALGSWCERRRRDLTRTLPLSRRVQIVVRWCVERAIVRSGLLLDRRTSVRSSDPETTIWASPVTSKAWSGFLSRARSLSLSPSLFARLTRKWFEVKIWASNHFRGQRLIFLVNFK